MHKSKNNSIFFSFFLFSGVEYRISAIESISTRNSLINSLLSTILVDIISNSSLMMSSSIALLSSLNFNLLLGSKVNKYLYLLKKSSFMFSCCISFSFFSFFSLIDFMKSSTFLLPSLSSFSLFFFFSSFSISLSL